MAKEEIREEDNQYFIQCQWCSEDTVLDMETIQALTDYYEEL